MPEGKDWSWERKHGEQEVNVHRVFSCQKEKEQTHKDRRSENGRRSCAFTGTNNKAARKKKP